MPPTRRLSATLVGLVLSLVSAGVLHAAPAVQHVVLFRFKEGADPGRVHSVVRDFAQLPSRIPGIVGYQWGTNNSPEGLDKGFTHAFVVTFESLAARDAYLPHPEHQKFVESVQPILDAAFVSDFEVADAPDPAEPGRTHHLVFFRYKDEATDEQVKTVRGAFLDLEKKIPGLLRVQTGPDRTPARFREGDWAGFSHPFFLTFTNERARNDYLPHPAHREFGKTLGPIFGDVLVVDFTVRPSTQALFVTHGVEPYRVYQRDEKGVATLKFGGVCLDDGTIEARLRSGRRTVPGFDWRRVGESTGGHWEASLSGVPTGGEYTVEVRRRDALGGVASHTEVANILVGDIWILAGQSNMEGVGNLVDVEEPSPLVHVYTMAHRWELAKEPLHWLIDSPDPIHSGPWLRDLDEAGRRRVRSEQRRRRTKGAGVGLPFAKEMVRRTGVPVGLVASAHGGTSMQQWDPSGRDRGGETLYGSMLKQVRNAGGKVKGVLWYQGESDANPQAAELFADRFEGLVSAFRSDLGDEALPFYYVQIGRFVTERPTSAAWDRVQELQRLAESRIPGVAMVSVIDLPLDDLIHVGTPGLKRAGVRLAKIAARECFGATGLQRGPRPEAVKIAAGGRQVRVTYSGVNGRLGPAQNIKGFSIQLADGKEFPVIFNARVDPDGRTVVLECQRPVPEGATLWYGRGLDPVCDLVDDEDMAAPVFGPLSIER